LIGLLSTSEEHMRKFAAACLVAITLFAPQKATAQVFHRALRGIAKLSRLHPKPPASESSSN